ncbi:hypothetical protein OAN76_02275, partial [Candidatus Marinimicrobia bacterium]|nr:hypothetical protein [Candidatus Neomarinimicrobiota bacterium]
MAMLSIPQLADKFQIPTERLRNELDRQNYIARVENEWTLTEKGINAGGKRRHNYGYYIVFPETFEISIKMLSIPKLAEKFQISVSRLRNELDRQNYIARVENEWTLTEKGINAGGKRRHNYGYYIVFPETFEISIKMLSIPKLAEKFQISVSRLRNELDRQNYIARVENKWTLTDKGIRAGGQPFNYYGTYIKFPENFQIDIGSSREIRSLKIPLPEPLRKAIINNIRDPIFNRTGTRGWRQHVTAKIQNNNFNIETQKFHRTSIVERGQADFTRSNLGLNTDELGLLYSYYYFQMHFSSTVALFYDLREIFLEKIINTSNKIYFVDIGCGPFTSGIAFLHFTRLRSTQKTIELRRNSIDLQYRGIDLSNSMLSLGKKLCTDYSSGIEDNGLYYSKISVSNSVMRVTRSIRNSGINSTIILNCCYLFASPSLDVDD